MLHFDHLSFDILRAIQGMGVPRSKRERSEWAERVSGKIAERLREGWEMKRKVSPPAPDEYRNRNMGPGDR